jgi:hypothetical protein
MRPIPYHPTAHPPTCTMNPPATFTARSFPIATPSPTADCVCSESARYRARSSATSPEWMGTMPVCACMFVCVWGGDRAVCNALVHTVLVALVA